MDVPRGFGYSLGTVMPTPRGALRAPALLAAALSAIAFFSLLGVGFARNPDGSSAQAGTPAEPASGGEQSAVGAPAPAVSKPANGGDESGESGGAGEAAAAEPKLEPGVDPDAEPLRVFASIESAWARGEADSLLVYFGEAKVALAFSRCGPRGGIFTRAQADYLLADLFAYSVTESFTFVKYRNIEEDGQLPYAVADRVYRLENGILYHDQVYVSLRKEGNDWKIAEIKSIDR